MMSSFAVLTSWRVRLLSFGDDRKASGLSAAEGGHEHQLRVFRQGISI